MVALTNLPTIISLLFQFNPSVPIGPEIPGFKKKTTLKDKVHCVCIVIDGSTGGVLPDKIVEQIKSIQSKINMRGKFTHCLLVDSSTIIALFQHI